MPNEELRMTRTVRIAWVEDDTSIIQPVVFRLERAGHQIDRYPSYAEAVLAKDVILASDLILLDIIIPNGDAHTRATPYLGIELVEVLYQVAMDRSSVFPPVLVLSAVSREQVVRDFKNKFAGKFGISHLRKPVLPTTLKERVDQLLQLRL
jgi:CheY-like chemotaxis protein